MKYTQTAKDYLNDLFPNFEPALRDLLAQRCELKHFPEGTMLMRTGQYFKSTMIIVTGRVKLFRENGEGQEFFMYDICEGQACALSLICAAKHVASEIMAKTTEDTLALLVPIDLMDTLMRQYSTWYYFVIDTYRQRFAELLNTIDQIAFKKLDERLETYLEREYQSRGQRELNITHQEIAGDLNTSREVISRLLKKMEQQGFLGLQRNHIYWKK